MSSRSMIASIKREISALRRQDGSLAPEDVVEWARTHPKSELHQMFLWDDAKAAHEHRLWQARDLIKTYGVVIEARSDEIEIVPIVSVPALRGTPGGSYLRRDVVQADEALRTDVLDEVRAKLRSMKDRYGPITPELSAVWKAVARIC